MPETGIINLSLKVAGGGFEDFFPYELNLEEGFSKVYRAKLTVFTKTRREQKNLRELLQRNISVTISQRITGGNASRQRYLHGLITGITSLGLVSRGGSAECYRHLITIESSLARLRHTRLSSSFYKKNPADIIEEILSKYNIQGEFSAQHLNRSSFSKNLMFEQVNMSDLDFIHYLMNTYGISWTSVHRKVREGNLETAQLSFTEGIRFPQPVYEYSDKRKIPDTEQFSFMDYNEGKSIWKIDSWNIESKIGVEGLKITAPYPQANFGSQEWKWGNVGSGKQHYNYDSLFHGYERRTPHEEIDTDIKRSIEAKKIVFMAERESRNGSAENIILMPGLSIQINHFQGIGDKTPINALVTDTQTYIRTLWPRDMAAPSAGTEPAEIAKVEFSAIDWGKDSEKRFCRITQ